VDLGFDKDKKTFKSGINPFIAIKREFDYGFYTHAAGLQPVGDTYKTYQNGYFKLEQKYIGTDFYDKAIFAGSKQYDHAPLGPDHNILRPFPRPEGSSLNKIDFAYVIDEGTPLNTVENLMTGMYVKGGLGFTEISNIEKPISTFIVNLYDLFGKMLKDETDKKAFNDLLQSFFMKEQSTITALVQRMLMEQFYPDVGLIYNDLTDQCYKNLSTAVAVASGDYQHTNNTGPSPLLAAELGQIGLQLLEGFLKSIASTVDPTWKTPWLSPGPLTPFGVVAKLLDEDFSDDREKPEEQLPPDETVCDDSLRESVNFFSGFVEDWKKSIGGEE